MAKMRTIGNIIPPRFVAFLVTLLVAVPLLADALHNPALGAMAGFDIAAIIFLILCVPLLRIRDSAVIESHAEVYDANRTLLLVLTAIVMAVLLIAIAAESVGRSPQPLTKMLIVATLTVAWLFSNTVYAFHYAHLAYYRPGRGAIGIEFPGTPEPIYWDFIYFAYTLGMTFQTSDVTISDQRIRRFVTLHCFGAFVFNIGVLAFTINVLGS
jgi:uncharacterized membrane protein